MFAIRIETKPNRNGNSRVGWLVYERPGVIVAFIEARGTGEVELHRAFRKFAELDSGRAVVTCVLEVTPGEWQRAKKAQRLREEWANEPSKEATPAQIERWLRVGKENPWISRAWDPPFTAASFKHCATVDELASELTRVSWSLGTAFYHKDLCLINQVDGGDEWLAIRHGIPFESVTFGPMIERGEFPRYIARFLAATEEQCRTLTY